MSILQTIINKAGVLPDSDPWWVIRGFENSTLYQQLKYNCDKKNYLKEWHGLVMISNYDWSEASRNSSDRENILIVNQFCTSLLFIWLRIFIGIVECLNIFRKKCRSISTEILCQCFLETADAVVPLVLPALLLLLEDEASKANQDTVLKASFCSDHPMLHSISKALLHALSVCKFC